MTTTMMSFGSHLIVMCFSAALLAWLRGKPSQPKEDLNNSAFVFVKTHANTVATQELVRKKLTASGITIVSELDIDGTTIDKKKLIDKHYYAIGT